MITYIPIMLDRTEIDLNQNTLTMRDRDGSGVVFSFQQADEMAFLYRSLRDYFEGEDCNHV